MEKFPRYLTKYFKWDDKKYLDAGSVKFGNTSEYRDAEEKMTLESRGDKKEGVRERYSFTHEGSDDEIPSSDFLDAYRMYYKDSPSNVHVSGNYQTTTMNAWVFCATIGSYDAEHHKKMLFGDDVTGYNGNQSLDGWCVFDTYEFLHALAYSLKQHVKFSRHDTEAKILYWRGVDYLWAPTAFANAREEYETISSHQQLSDDDVVKLLTTKREVFSTEKEFRIIARIDERPEIPDHEPALIVQNPSIYNSIVRFGRF